MARTTTSKSKGDDGSGVGEERTGPIAGTAFISGATFTDKAVQYADIDGMAVFEGDIVLGTVQEFEEAAGRQAAGDAGPTLASIGITGQQFRWPNGVIPYEIDPNMPNQQRVTDAIAHWEANTTIRFPLRSSGTFTDFVRFQSGSGCSSQIGRRGGQQVITLGTNCTTGNAIHEIGHTVGLWHEQSREDRDTFIQIVWANIDPAFQHNFLQHISDGDDLGAYDYGSIMHYPPTAFSTNGQDTIIPLQPLPAGVTMGQRTGLSPGDLAGVRMMYPTVGTIKEIRKDPLTDTVKEPRKDPIRDTIKELRKDPISDTIKEPRKDPIRDTAKEPAKDPIRDTIKEIRKDPIQDPTVKEVQKDPIQDPTTFKELRKDPIRDPIPTAKEVGRDPGTFVEVREIPRYRPSLPGDSEMPFVMATPSRAGYGYSDMGEYEYDPLAEAEAEVLALEEALMASEAEYAELTEMYEAAVQQLEALQGGL